MRVFGLRSTGNPMRGFPFDADGVLASSRPVLTDLDGDGVKDLVLLVSEGGNGGWRLLAWSLGSLVRGTAVTASDGTPQAPQLRANDPLQPAGQLPNKSN